MDILGLEYERIDLLLNIAIFDTSESQGWFHLIFRKVKSIKMITNLILESETDPPSLVRVGGKHNIMVGLVLSD
jgi:hypothetical protein